MRERGDDVVELGMVDARTCVRVCGYGRAGALARVWDVGDLARSCGVACGRAGARSRVWSVDRRARECVCVIKGRPLSSVFGN